MAEEVPRRRTGSAGLVLIGTGTMPIGDGTDMKFPIRMLQMAAATGYVVLALTMVTLYRQRNKPHRTAPMLAV